MQSVVFVKMKTLEKSRAPPVLISWVDMMRLGECYSTQMPFNVILQPLHVCVCVCLFLWSHRALPCLLSMLQLLLWMWTQTQDVSRSNLQYRFILSELSPLILTDFIIGADRLQSVTCRILRCFGCFSSVQQHILTVSYNLKASASIPAQICRIFFLFLRTKWKKKRGCSDQRFWISLLSIHLHFGWWRPR